MKPNELVDKMVNDAKVEPTPKPTIPEKPKAPNPVAKPTAREKAEQFAKSKGYTGLDDPEYERAYGQIRYGKEYNYWKGNDDYRVEEPVYNENDGWESWANAMDEFVPKGWETDGWDGNTRIYTAPNGDSVWVHAGGGVTVYPANFNGPNDIKSYDSVTEYINGSKKAKTNVPQEQPKTDWHEKGFMLGRQNGLSDEESDELATLIYNFMKNKNK